MRGVLSVVSVSVAASASPAATPVAVGRSCGDCATAGRTKQNRWRNGVVSWQWFRMAVFLLTTGFQRSGRAKAALALRRSAKPLPPTSTAATGGLSASVEVESGRRLDRPKLDEALAAARVRQVPLVDIESASWGGAPTIKRTGRAG